MHWYSSGWGKHKRQTRSTARIRKGITSDENWERSRHKPGRISRPGSGKVPPAPAEGRVGGGEREGRGGEGGGPAPGDIVHFRAFIADDQSGTTYGGCGAMTPQGHRVVGLPCGRQHAMHARCVVDAVTRGGAQALLLCGARGCTVRDGRREGLGAADQSDPGLRVTAARLGGRPDDGEEGRRDGLCYPWEQNTLGIAGPLCDAPLEDLQQRFVTAVKVQPRLATAHAKLITRVPGLLNHTLGEHRQSTQSETPQSLLRSLKLWFILPNLLHSQNGRMKRRERFASAERGDVTLFLPWLMEYTCRTSTRQSGQAREEMDADMFKRASSACRHREGVTAAARSLLAEPHAPGNEETWERVKAKFPEEDQTCVSEAAAAALAASSFDPEEGSGPNWRPEEEFDPQVVLEVINSRNALPGAGCDGLRFSHFSCSQYSGLGSGGKKTKLALKLSGEESSMIQLPSRLNSGSSSSNPTSRPWVKNAASCAWG